MNRAEVDNKSKEVVSK